MVCSQVHPAGYCTISSPPLLHCGTPSHWRQHSAAAPHPQRSTKQTTTVSAASGLCTLIGWILLARGDFPELAVTLIGNDVQRPIRTLPHVAYSLVPVLEQVLLASDPVVLQRETHQLGVPHAADEHAALPGGERITSVELHPRWRDHRVPVIDRLLGAFLGGDGALDCLTGVLLTIRYQRPAVVLPLLHQVQLVPAFGTMLDLPQAALRIERGSLDVPVAQRPDLRAGVGLPGKGIVLWNRAIRVDPENLSHVAVELLRLGPHLLVRPLAQGDVEHAIGSE